MFGRPIRYRVFVSEPASCPIDKDARIAELEAALAARDTLIETLRFQLSQLRRMPFGQSPEKLALQIEQLELALEELEGEAERASACTTAAAVAMERPASVRRFPDHLARIERRIEPEAAPVRIEVVPVSWTGC